MGCAAMYRVRHCLALLLVPLCALSAGCQPPDDQQDGGSSADAGSGTDAGLPGLDNWLRNAPEVCGGSMLIPDPGEEGHLAAARLTPSRYPFSVQFVRYIVGDGPASGSAGAVECQGTASHDIEIYVDTTTAPPANPSALYQATIPTADPSEIGHEGRVVRHDLPTPLLLEEGEHLFVAIAFAGTHPDVMCLPVNDQDAYEGDRNYWSTTPAPAQGWVQLDSFGLVGSILVSAYGEPQS